MPRKKKETQETQEPQATRRQLSGNSQATRRKVQEVPEAVYIYHTGDDIRKIAKLLTGSDYMGFAILSYSGLTWDTLKDGDILKWRI